MATCAIPLKEKQVLVRKVGKHLITLRGKRRHYSPPLIKAAMRKCEFPNVWDCWALSLFASPRDFSSYHAAIGETCDCTAMHSEMLTTIHSGSLLDFLSMDWSDSSLVDISPSDLTDHHF